MSTRLPFRLGPRLVLAGVLLLASDLGALQPAPSAGRPSGGAPPDSALRPDSSLSPDQVVAIVLRALQHNDEPTKDRGIATTFEFASPANRQVTGPLERFTELVKNSDYRPMLNHRSAERGTMRVVGERARQTVSLVDVHGERVVYVFLLSRQRDGRYKGCWMTDGVARDVESEPMRYYRVTSADGAPTWGASRGE